MLPKSVRGGGGIWLLICCMYMHINAVMSLHYCCNVRLRYSCWTAPGVWCWKKTKISTISLYNFPPLFHTPHPLLVGIHAEGPAVCLFTPDQVILYYSPCFLRRQGSWDDWLSDTTAKPNSGIYLWTRDHHPHSPEMLIKGRDRSL